MGHVIVEWLMIIVGAGSMLLGIVFGVVDRILRLMRRLQRPPDKP